MKAYSKPIAELENFCLDSEFAAGGCSVIPESVRQEYQDTFDGNLDCVLLELEEYNLGYSDGTEWLRPIAVYNNLDFATFVAMDPNSAEFVSAVDNYSMYMVNNSQDDLNSGFCYFTFNSASGKSFS